MGYTTDFIGHVDVNPPMNRAEQEYLAAFGQSRRYDRPGGPYDVPGNPVAELTSPKSVSTATLNRGAESQPGLWCDWTPCWDGCCLSYNGYEKFYNGTRWLIYLIEHFLRPGAYARASGLAQFAEFGFDHYLDGIIAGCRRDNKELFLIRVEDNQVREEVLRPADRRYVDFPPLAYEEEIDRWEGERTKKRKARRSR